MTFVKDIYDEINRMAPFNLAEKGDNVGLLVGNENCKVTKVLLALDITNTVVEEAVKFGAELIFSHHPVIYNPLYSLNEKNPACHLLKNNINAICAHTNLDMTHGGVNDILIETLGLKKSGKFLEVIHKKEENGNHTEFGFGEICTLNKTFMPKEFAQHIKETLNCKVIRYIDTQKPIRNIAVCCGGGGSLLPLVLLKKIDAYISGDIKHDQFITAKNAELALFDAGHFHTETIVIPYIKKVLSEKFSDIEFKIAEENKDPVSYKI